MKTTHLLLVLMVLLFGSCRKKDPNAPAINPFATNNDVKITRLLYDGVVYEAYTYNSSGQIITETYYDTTGALSEGLQLKYYADRLSARYWYDNNGAFTEMDTINYYANGLKSQMVYKDENLNLLETDSFYYNSASQVIAAKYFDDNNQLFYSKELTYNSDTSKQEAYYDNSHSLVNTIYTTYDSKIDPYYSWTTDYPEKQKHNAVSVSATYYDVSTGTYTMQFNGHEVSGFVYGSYYDYAANNYPVKQHIIFGDPVKHEDWTFAY